MWGADYPHSEGAFGLTQKAIHAMVADVGETAGRLIFGGNAKRVFGI
jgi:predicted TIM-barrel fold metal-dependent hydrolase